MTRLFLLAGGRKDDAVIKRDCRNLELLGR